MNLNSPLFDRVRVRQADDPTAKPQERVCQHMGCALAGVHRAPMGRHHEGKYLWFCLDHVRAYNQSYNYFTGMSDDAVAAYQKEALTGHRPTWKMGVNGATQAEKPAGPTWSDPYDTFGLGGFDPRRGRRPPPEEKPAVGQVARKAMETLGVDPGTPGPEIKSRYKGLVKRFHPDANGGDRSHEERLREIIRAYNTLRAMGYC